MENKTTKEQVVGTWYMLSLTYKGSDGKEHDYMGANPQGIIQYTHDGIVSTQFMDGHRARFSTDDWANAPLEEIKEAFISYQAYYGTYEFDETTSTAHHHVKGSIFPNWHIDKMTEIRYVAIDGDILTITMPPILVMGDEKFFTAVWTKKMPDYMK